MAAIAFIGLGQMGSPMASNLLQQGHQLRVFDVNAEAVASAFADHATLRLIHGHTHRPARHEFACNGRLVERLVLGDWYQRGSMMRTEGPSSSQLLVWPHTCAN